MTRKFLLTSTTIATLVAAPMAYASGTIADELPTNSPEVSANVPATDGGSTLNNYDTNNKRYGLGIADYDPTTMSLTDAEYAAVKASVGANFETQDGEVLGVVKGISFDGQGNPEMVVDLEEDTKIDAEVLVVTLLPDSLRLDNGQIVIDTTADGLYLKAQQGSKADDETRTTVIVM
ncbi:hypothetical protein [Sulfitobacter mediterraneus]|uniref:PRC-barrel domain protein n=1 Tax=Sulfitobacter mediterraneus TaxID=83219 RepID=A0A061SXW1_9RHOB|nr:hypothetical protein [Sulfitobacter mediterraneus]KAJ05044.1 hypothetical protein PM02_01080 [Sulfitobacter mediterraneus]